MDTQRLKLLLQSHTIMERTRAVATPPSSTPPSQAAIAVPKPTASAHANVASVR